MPYAHYAVGLERVWLLLVGGRLQALPMGSPSPDAVPSRSTDHEKAQLPAGPTSPLSPADFCRVECPVLTKPAASPDVHFVTPAGMLRTRAEERPGQVAFT